MAGPYLGSIEDLTVNELDSSVSQNGDSLASRKRINALSNKLTSALSSSYADTNIRNALRLLDARGPANAEQIRKDLKSNAQKEVIDRNAAVVDDFGKVAEQLKRVGSLVNALNQTCDELKQHILAAKQETGPVLEEASTLLARKRETESKQRLWEAFCQHFLISNDDLNHLTSSAEPVDDRFFSNLSRVKQINKDCEILLGSENQRLGLELMEQSTRNLDAAFKKLYNWIQKEFKGLDLEDPHISGSIRRALRVLSERPTMFQNCLDYFAEARESTLSDAFQSALTGSATDSTKAIDFSTHDPLRYIGDMLAWIHSAAVSEKESLEGLFISDAAEISKGLNAGKISEPWARARRDSDDTIDIKEDPSHEDTVFDGKRALNELVGRNLAAVSQTLQYRIDTTLRSSGEPIMIYKAYNLLTFYRDIFLKLLGPESSITNAISNLESSTLTQFEEAMEEETSTATNENTPNAELSPPALLINALKQFSEVIRARNSQLTSAELERLFRVMLSGILDACAEGATALTDTRQSSIYKMNYLGLLESTLSQTTKYVSSASIPLERASKEIFSLHNLLVEHLTTTFLEDSGVTELFLDISQVQNQQRQQQEHVDDDDGSGDTHAKLASILDIAATKLDSFLSSALMDAQESLRLLGNRSLAKEIINEAVEKFCIEFDELEVLLEKIDDEFLSSHAEDEDEQKMTDTKPALRELYPRTNAEVRALLS